eukprot:352193-Chlamydomonas_euryale.AAC.22
MLVAPAPGVGHDIARARACSTWKKWGGGRTWAMVRGGQQAAPSPTCMRAQARQRGGKSAQSRGGAKGGEGGDLKKGLVRPQHAACINPTGGLAPGDAHHQSINHVARGRLHFLSRNADEVACAGQRGDVVGPPRILATSPRPLPMRPCMGAPRTIEVAGVATLNIKSLSRRY